MAADDGAADDEIALATGTAEEAAAAAVQATAAEAEAEAGTAQQVPAEAAQMVEAVVVARAERVATPAEAVVERVVEEAVVTAETNSILMEERLSSTPAVVHELEVVGAVTVDDGQTPEAAATNSAVEEELPATTPPPVVTAPVEIEPFPEACETSEMVKQMSAKEKVAVNAEIWESEGQIGPKQANDEAASGVNGGMCLINSSPDVHGAIALEQDVLRNNTISSSDLMKKDHAEKRGILLNEKAGHVAKYAKSLDEKQQQAIKASLLQNKVEKEALVAAQKKSLEQEKRDKEQRKLRRAQRAKEQTFKLQQEKDQMVLKLQKEVELDRKRCEQAQKQRKADKERSEIHLAAKKDEAAARTEEAKRLAKRRLEEEHEILKEMDAADKAEVFRRREADRQETANAKRERETALELEIAKGVQRKAQVEAKLSADRQAADNLRLKQQQKRKEETAAKAKLYAQREAATTRKRELEKKRREDFKKQEKAKKEAFEKQQQASKAARAQQFAQQKLMQLQQRGLPVPSELKAAADLQSTGLTVDHEVPVPSEGEGSSFSPTRERCDGPSLGSREMHSPSTPWPANGEGASLAGTETEGPVTIGPDSPDVAHASESEGGAIGVAADDGQNMASIAGPTMTEPSRQDSTDAGTGKETEVAPQGQERAGDRVQDTDTVDPKWRPSEAMGRTATGTAGGTREPSTSNPSSPTVDACVETQPVATQAQEAIAVTPVVQTGTSTSQPIDPSVLVSEEQSQACGVSNPEAVSQPTAQESSDSLLPKIKQLNVPMQPPPRIRTVDVYACPTGSFPQNSVHGSQNLISNLSTAKGVQRMADAPRSLLHETEILEAPRSIAPNIFSGRKLSGLHAPAEEGEVTEMVFRRVQALKGRVLHRTEFTRAANRDFRAELVSHGAMGSHPSQLPAGFSSTRDRMFASSRAVASARDAVTRYPMEAASNTPRSARAARPAGEIKLHRMGHVKSLQM